eukprot:4371607-Alexandrium_andersonii.AAC.1
MLSGTPRPGSGTSCAGAGSERPRGRTLTTPPWQDMPSLPLVDSQAARASCRFATRMVAPSRGC